MMPKLIGIAGGSGAGKSAIVRTLVERIGGSVIELDSYYLDRSSLGRDQRTSLNYDEPAALDVALLSAHLRQLAAGETIQKPVYSFTTHTRVASESVGPGQFVIVEGLFTLWWPELRALLDLKIFVEASADLRLVRRIKRDVTDRERTLDQVLQQYVATVRPMHDRFVEPTRHHADVVIVNDVGGHACVETLITAIQRRMADGSREAGWSRH